MKIKVTFDYGVAGVYRFEVDSRRAEVIQDLMRKDDGVLTLPWISEAQHRQMLATMAEADVQAKAKQAVLIERDGYHVDMDHDPTAPHPLGRLCYEHSPDGMRWVCTWPRGHDSSVPHIAGDEDSVRAVW